MRFAALVFCAIQLAYATERFQTYTTDDGLPSDAIQAIRQTHDGYIWFTTPRGIVRFDGVRFQIFNPSNTPALHGTNFAMSSLMEDRRGALWAGTWNSGAICYQHGVFRSYTTRDGLPNNFVVRIDEDAQGDIWIYSNPGLSKIHDGKLEAIPNLDGVPVRKYDDERLPANLELDSYFWGLWRIENGKLQRFAYGQWQTIPLPDGVDAHKVKLNWMVEDSQRRFHFSILGHPGQSFQVFNGKLEVFSGLPAGAFVNYQDRFGRLWITDTAGHVATWKAGHIERVEGVPASSLFRVMEDESGGFWIGTQSSGLAHGTERAITNVKVPGGPDANVIVPITQDGAGNIWTGGYGLTRLASDGKMERFTQTKTGTELGMGQEIFSLWAERDGTILCGNETGVKVFKNGRFLEAPPPLNGIRAHVGPMVRDQEGTLWLGSNDGLYRLQNGRLTLFNSLNSPTSGQVRVVYEDGRGTLWWGTDDCLCRYRSHQMSCFQPHGGLDQWRVLSITSDAHNVIWAGTADRGLVRVEGDEVRWISEADGLPSNDAGGILDDGQGNFWVGTQVGIYRVRREALNDFVRWRSARVETTLFRKADGLEGSNFRGSGYPHGLVAMDGTLWFPSSVGLVHIDPKTVRSDPFPPKISIESCLLEQRALACASELTIPPDGKNLEIHYTALSLLRADQTRFRYRLAGVDRDWLYVGSRNVAYYSHLDPGSYHFEVSAANSDGVWNARPQKLHIVVLPHFYESLAFRMFLLCAAAAALWSAWRLRTLQFQRRQAQQRGFSRQVIASQEAERKRIAGELHDGLGQRLSLISNLALMADHTKNGDRSHEIHAIVAEASQAADDVRQISRNLRPVQLDLVGLSSAMKNLTETMCESAGLEPEIAIDDLTGVLPKELEIHLYRVLQECLHNIVKHAQATRVSVLVRREGRTFSLVVNDNGLGFSLDGREGRLPAKSFGLIGIKERSELLGGKALIRSIAGRGTTVTIETVEPG